MCNDRILIVTITLVEINMSLHAFISTHIQNSTLTSGYTDALNHKHPGDRVSNYINNVYSTLNYLYLSKLLT